MLMDFTNVDELDRYYGGQMSENEKTMFQNRLLQDPELARENDMYQLLVQGIEQHGEKAVELKLSAIRAKLQDEQYFDSISEPTVQPMTNMSARRGWFAIAAALVLALAAIVFFQKNNAVSPEEAFARYYKPESVVLPKLLDDLERVGFAEPNAPANDTLVRALKAYEAQEYDNALTQLQVYLLAHPEDQLAKMYLGLTLMQKSEYGKAIAQLGPLASDDAFANKYTARWYLALSLTQVKNADSMRQAKSWLIKLADDPSSGYAKEAEGMMGLLGMKR
jgi:predicted negative regulator of RcsB-dependent stress response